MPAIKAKSKKKKDINEAVSANIDEQFHHPGAHNKAINKKFGKNSKKAQQIRIAAAENMARGGKKRKSKNGKGKS